MYTLRDAKYSIYPDVNAFIVAVHTIVMDNYEDVIRELRLENKFSVLVQYENTPVARVQADFTTLITATSPSLEYIKAADEIIYTGTDELVVADIWRKVLLIREDNWPTLIHSTKAVPEEEFYHIAWRYYEA